LLHARAAAKLVHLAALPRRRQAGQDGEVVDAKSIRAAAPLRRRKVGQKMH
jgi:phosphotransferase system HPr-like phosphotransfer protein